MHTTSEQYSPKICYSHFIINSKSRPENEATELSSDALLPSTGYNANFM